VLRAQNEGHSACRLAVNCYQEGSSENTERRTRRFGDAADTAATAGKLSPLHLSLLSDDFHQHALPAPSVELAVENLFPRAEVQFAFGDRDDDFPAHDLTFEMGVSVVFASTVVSIRGSRLVRSEFFQPLLVIVMESRFIIVDENRSGDVHGVDKTKPFPHATLTNQFLDRRRDVDQSTPGWNFEPEMLGERFQV
jgi:hypothetical protein